MHFILILLWRIRNIIIITISLKSFYWLVNRRSEFIVATTAMHMSYRARVWKSFRRMVWKNVIKILILHGSMNPPTFEVRRSVREVEHFMVVEIYEDLTQSHTTISSQISREALNFLLSANQ